MPEIKNTFTQGKMNKDLDERIIQSGQYRDAMNIQVSTSEGSDIGTVQNILGNTLMNINYDTDGTTVLSSSVVGGTWECVGSIADEKNDVLYSFIASPNRGGAILEVSKDGDVTPVLVDFDKSVLKFTVGDMITGINVIDGLLLWTDGENEPKKINIQRCKDGTGDDLSTHTKLIVNGERVLDKVVTTNWITAFTSTTGGTTVLTLSGIGTASEPEVEIGDQLIEFETTSGSLYNPSNRFVTNVNYSTGEVTINNSIYNGTGTSAIGNLVKFEGFVKIREEHITVIKKRPTQAPKMEITRVGDRPLPSGSFNEFSLSGHSAGETSVTFTITLPEYVVLPTGILFPPSPFPDPYIDISGHQTDSTGSQYAHDQNGIDLVDAHAYNVQDDDILLLSDPAAQGVLPNNVQIRLLVTDVTTTVAKYSGYFLQTIICTILTIDSGSSLDTINYDFVIEDLENLLFEKSFPRFATRYKYEDGEYSAFSPFTQVGFAPGEFSIHPTKEPYNSAMDTRVKKVALKEFVTHDIPNDVTEIDLLYKNDDSNIVYVIDSIVKKDTTTDTWDIVNLNHSTNPPTKEYFIQLPSDTFDASTGLPNFDSSTIPSNTGYFEINSKNIHAAIHSKQLLRPWDNVPKKAKAQDFTANRLIYGNYTQNLDLGDYIPNVILRHEKRNFAGESTNFDIGIESIKSQRTYQGGVVFGDEFGRETPVFTSKNGSITIPYDTNSGVGFDGAASQSNRLYFKHYTDNLPVHTSAPTTPNPDSNLLKDPYYYKVFIKETASEYYNLVMDRVYRAEEDGNLWISFPSSDRNKIQEDDYIILKKSLGIDNILAGQVEIENKFKVIDIKNEAPEFIKKKHQELGELDGNGNLSDLYFNDSQKPYAGVNTLVLSKDSVLSENLSDIQKGYDKGKKYSITFNITNANSDKINSKRYNIISLVTTSSSQDFYTIILDKPIVSSDGWVESSVGILDTSLKTVIWKEEIQEWEEFQGRFFVKILSNIITDEYLEKQIGTSVTNVVAAQDKLFYVGDDVDADSSGGDPSLADGLYAGLGYQENNPYNTGGSGISNEKTDWAGQILHFDKGESTSKWFIDSAFSVSQQPTIISDTSDAVQFGNNDVPAGTANANVHDVSTSWDLRKSYGVNGMSGCFTTNVHYTNTSYGAYMWKSQKGNFGDVGEPDVYGAETGKFYMHLSFSKVGEDLHSGPADIGGFNITSWVGSQWATSPNSWDLQNIHNYNQQRNWYRVCPWNQTYGTIDPPGSDAKWANQWNPAWDGINVEIIKNLVIGGKFQFSDDVNGEVFTIKKVTEKHLYNHTSWNRVMYWNDSASAWHEDPDGNSVYNEYEVWLANKVEANFIRILQKVIDFGQANNRRVCYILELDKDPNSNLVSDGTNDGIQDIIFNLGDNDAIEKADGTTVVQTPTFMRFLKSYVSENSTVLSDDPAVWETEPKEDTDLDIYYEASDAIPITLDMNAASADSNGYPAPDNRKGHMIAPIGTAVRCTKTNSHLSTPGFGDCVVKSWDGNIVELDPGVNVIIGVEIFDGTFYPSEAGYTTTLSTSSIADQVYVFRNSELKLYKKDLSYITTAIYEPEEKTGSLITKFSLGRSVNKKIGLPYFNCYSFGNGVESNRIRDDFNKPYISNGVKASSTLHEQYKEDTRGSGLIYSGLYNKTTSFNELNQFIMADKITKELSPTYGSIQKLFTRDEDLIAFCEDKVVQIFADKDILYNADGNPQLLSSNKVLGQSRPFEGEYGISKNPESFAKESYRAYFVDKQRGAVLRLSKDGLTPISDAGMSDWFRDELKNPQFNIIGSYDSYKKDYNLTLDGGSGTPSDSYTLTYSEDVKGWVSFKSFIQESGVSMSGDYYTFKAGKCWKHDNTNRNTFYTSENGGGTTDSFITFIMNDTPSIIKNFNTLNYDGDGEYVIAQDPLNNAFTGWICESISTGGEPGDPNYQSGTVNGFIEKEGKFFNYIKGDVNANLDVKAFSFQGIGIASNIEYSI